VIAPVQKAEEDGFEFRAPAAFWCSSTVDMSAVVIQDQDGNDFTRKLQQRHSLVHGNRLLLTIQSRDAGQAVVGVGISFSAPIPSLAPKSLKIANRRYRCGTSAPRKYCLPLKKDEVEAGGPVVLEIESAGSRVEIDEFQVHLIPWKRPARPALDWKMGRSLRDFADEPEQDFDTDFEFIVASLSAAKFRKVDGDKEAAVRLIELMYSRPKIAGMCRRMVLKRFDDQAEIEDIWTAGLKAACETGKVHPDMIGLMWRDFSLLSEEKQTLVGAHVWKYADVGPGGHAIVASLLL
jgi:hypothetical protein